MLDGIQNTLAGGGAVNFTGFGKFSVAERGPRQGVNPGRASGSRSPAGRVPKFSAGAGPEVQGQGRLTPARPFTDRLAALVEERRSQVCRPRPGPAGSARPSDAAGERRRRAADAVARWCERVVDQAGPACVAAKPQLACFERLGAPGWAALAGRRRRAAAGLLVIADGKRGDVPVSRRPTPRRSSARRPRRGATPRGSAPTPPPSTASSAPDSLEPLIDVADERGRAVRPGPHLESGRRRPARPARARSPVHRADRAISSPRSRPAQGEVPGCRAGRGRRRDRARPHRSAARPDAARGVPARASAHKGATRAARPGLRGPPGRRPGLPRRARSRERTTPLPPRKRSAARSGTWLARTSADA